MATFHQQGQTVNYQYNADTINFEHIQTQASLIVALETLQREVDNAIKTKALTQEQALEARQAMNQAVQQAKKDSPDKSSLLKHIHTVKDIVSGIGGLATAFKSAIVAITALFKYD